MPVLLFLLLRPLQPRPSWGSTRSEVRKSSWTRGKRGIKKKIFFKKRSNPFTGGDKTFKVTSAAEKCLSGRGRNVSSLLLSGLSFFFSLLLFTFGERDFPSSFWSQIKKVEPQGTLSKQCRLPQHVWRHDRARRVGGDSVRLPCHRVPQADPWDSLEAPKLEVNSWSSCRWKRPWVLAEYISCLSHTNMEWKSSCDGKNTALHRLLQNKVIAGHIEHDGVMRVVWKMPLLPWLLLSRHSMFMSFKDITQAFKVISLVQENHDGFYSVQILDCFKICLSLLYEWLTSSRTDLHSALPAIHMLHAIHAPGRPISPESVMGSALPPLAWFFVPKLGHTLLLTGRDGGPMTWQTDRQTHKQTGTEARASSVCIKSDRLVYAWLIFAADLWFLHGSMCVCLFGQVCLWVCVCVTAPSVVTWLWQMGTWREQYSTVQAVSLCCTVQCTIQHLVTSCSPHACCSGPVQCSHWWGYGDLLPAQKNWGPGGSAPGGGVKGGRSPPLAKKGNITAKKCLKNAIFRISTGGTLTFYRHCTCHSLRRAGKIYSGCSNFWTAQHALRAQLKADLALEAVP